MSQGTRKGRIGPQNELEENDNAVAGPSRLHVISKERREVDWYIRELDANITEARLRAQNVPNLNKWVWRQSPRNRRDTILLQSRTTFTPEDKAAFFIALSRHSRWRPDLIAKDIKRETYEVDFYLKLLEQGLDDYKRNEGLHNGKRDRSKRYQHRYWWEEGMAAAAREMSDEWIEKEESLAERARSLINDREDKHQKSAKAALRAMQRKDARKADKEATNPGIQYKGNGKESFESLNRQWGIDDWLEDLTREKLDALDWIFTHRRSRWLSQHQNTIPNRSELSIGAGDAPPQLEAEDKVIKVLSAIPQTDRTAEERLRLDMLLNKRRKRLDYRTQQLLDRGLTMKEIENQGGVDEVFHLHAKRKRDPLDDRNHPGTDAKRKYRVNSPEKATEASPMTLEEIALIKEVEEYGIDVNMAKKGLDLFNYQRIFEFIDAIQAADDAQEDIISLSCSILDILCAQLKRFLAELILQIVTRAEQEYAISEAEHSKTVTSSHVKATLRARHIQPQQTILAILESTVWKNRNLDTGIADRNPRSADDEAGAPEEQAKMRDTVTLSGLTHAIDEPAALEDESEGEYYSGLDTDTSDQEDVDLEDLLDPLDVAYDQLYEHRLWKWMDRSEPSENYHDPWKKLKLPEDPGDELQTLYGIAQTKQQEYTEHQRDVGTARRKRRSIKNRSAQMPTTGLRRKSGKLRHYRTDITVVDSEDEGEGDAQIDEIESEED